MNTKSLQKQISAFFCLSALCAAVILPALCFGQPEPETYTDVTVTGKVFVEQQGEEQQVLLHSIDAKAYLLKGNLVQKLKTIAQGNSNRTIVTLEGKQSNRGNTSCSRSRNDKTDAKGGTIIEINAHCVRYYFLYVTAISSIAESDEKMPEPQSDKSAEQQLINREDPNLNERIVGEFYGKIRSFNLRSVPKTVEIKAIDRNNPLKTLTVIITASTRIVKKIKNAEPSPLLPENLKIGQRVTVVYARNEIRTEALYITVTKE